MTLTIGIVNYNTKDDLNDCLNHILKSPPEVSYSIIIVDNNSTDESIEFLENLNKKRISFILNNENKGF